MSTLSLTTKNNQETNQQKGTHSSINFRKALKMFLSKSKKISKYFTQELRFPLQKAYMPIGLKLDLYLRYRIEDMITLHY